MEMLVPVSIYLHSLWISLAIGRSVMPTPETFAASAVSGLFSAVWEGAVLVICAAIFLKAFKGLSAAARSVVWLTVFLFLTVLQVAPYFGSRSPAAGSVHRSTVELDWRWSLALAAVWGLLSLLRAVQLVWSAVRLRALAGRATPIAVAADLQELLSVRTAGSKAARLAVLCASDEVERPSVFGFFRPLILVPPVLLERLSEFELRQVVLHEMEHLRRADDWTNLLQKMALVVFPLNPALVWVERRLCAERELACDDRVVEANVGRKAYALCLAHLAEYSMLHRGLSLVLGAWERRPELVRRVHRILRRPQGSMSARQTIALTGGLIAGVLACAVGLARSPQLVGFVGPSELAALKAPARASQFAGLRVAEASVRGDVRNEVGAAGSSDLPVRLLPARAVMANAVMPEGSSAAIPTSIGQVNSAANALRRNVGLRKAKRQAVPDAAGQGEGQAWVETTEWTQREVAPGLVLTVWHNDRRALNGSVADGPVEERQAGEDADSRARRADGQVQVHEQPAQGQAVEERQVKSAQPRYAAVPFGNGWLIIQI